MTDNTALLDMNNRISPSELEKIIKMNLEAIGNTPALSKKIPPIMIWGAPGLGKSTILRSIAADLGIGFIDIRLAQMEPVDIKGLPVPNHQKNCVDWLVSGQLPRRDGRGILLCDELSSADKSIQVAAYELILDRRLGDLYKLPDGWYVVAAGNRVEDSAVATTMSSALANRFLHVELAEDVEDWCKWALLNDIHPAVVSFIRFRPECLLRQKGENLERGWPTPRAWERVSTMLNIVPADNEALQRKMIYGLVGNNAGMEFFEFYKVNAEFEDVKQMMLNPLAEVNVPAKVDRKYAFCAAMSYFLWRGKTPAEEAALLDGFYRISQHLTSDFASLVMCDVMSGTGIISEIEAAKRLFHHPEYKEWAKIHGKAMKKHLSI